MYHITLMQHVHCFSNLVQQDSCIPLVQPLLAYHILLQVDVATLLLGPRPPKRHGIAAIKGQYDSLALAPLRQFGRLAEEPMMVDHPWYVGEKPEDVVLVVQKKTAAADVFAVLRCSAAAAVTANGEHL